MRETDIEALRQLPLFENATAETLRVATAGVLLQPFTAGTALLIEGAPSDCLYVLLDGQVELHASWNGSDTVLSIARPISMFILAAIVLDADALMSARTLERSLIAMIPGDAVRTAMRLDPHFAGVVARELAGGYRGMVRSTKNIKLRNNSARLANYLLQLRAAGGCGAVVRLPYEKRVIASLLGMTPESLSRSFSALGTQGILVSGPVVTIRDVSALEAIAKADPLIDMHAPRCAEIRADTDAEIWAREQARTSCR